MVKQHGERTSEFSVIFFYGINYYFGIKRTCVFCETKRICYAVACWDDSGMQFQACFNRLQYLQCLEMFA
jgi:hypothetical protein